MYRICIRKVVDSGSWIVNRDFYDSLFTIHYSRSKGFTLLELLVTLAVIAAITAVASSPAIDQWNAQKTFTNSLNSFQAELSALRNEAMMRNTTTRMTVTASNGTYTINTYYAGSAVSSCNSGSVSNTMVTNRDLDMHSKYQLTGAAMSNICFYRDGSSSGGTFTIAPITTTTGLKTATITVTIATGYLDVVVQ